MSTSDFSAKEFLMRYTPAAAALSLLAAITASASHSALPEQLDPRTAALLAEGKAAISAGQMNKAVDAYESALTVQPASITVLLGLAEATLKQGMQGKALHYYREALEADPDNLQAIAGEGTALAEKGAVEKARRNLVRLEGLCGKGCEASRELAAAISRSTAPRVVTAEAVKPAPVVSEN